VLAAVAQCLSAVPETGAVPSSGAPGSARWLLAFSGGLDSTVLLHALVRVAGPRAVLAVHVRHGLQAAGDAWPQHCVAQAALLGVPCAVVSLPPAQVQGQGLEAWARRERYRVLAAQAAQSGAQAVLTAHHADDQAETVLLRLARGAGVRGLAGMPARRPLSDEAGAPLLLRPLLGLTRAQVADYAQRHVLQWVEDPSNANLHHARNRVRLEVMPALSQAVPGAPANLLRAAGHLAEARQVLDEIADADLAAARAALVSAEVPVALRRLLAASVGGGLHRGPWRALSPARQRLALRGWLEAIGQAPPPLSVLSEAQRQLIQAHAASGEVALAEVTLRRLRDWLWAEPRTSLPQHLPWPMQAVWQGEAFIALPDGCLRVSPSRSAAAIPAEALHGQAIQVQAVAASARLRLRPGGMSRSLKHWHQAMGVPVWLRAALPGVFLNGRLLSVAGLGDHHPRAAASAVPVGHETPTPGAVNELAAHHGGVLLRWEAPPGDPRHALCAEPPPEGHPV
jgi:tRNA(Ile)-lysidine synthase